MQQRDVELLLELADLLPELERAGVARVALLSSGAVGTAGPDNADAAYHRASEQALRDSRLGWTFVRPSTFMSNSLRWADSIRRGEPVVAPFADVAIATNDPRDVAAVAAASLTAGGHEEEIYRVTGPRALLPAEQVEILGSVLGRELSFEAQSNDAARDEMDRTMSKAYVDAFFELFLEGKQRRDDGSSHRQGGDGFRAPRFPCVGDRACRRVPLTRARPCRGDEPPRRHASTSCGSPRPAHRGAVEIELWVRERFRALAREHLGSAGVSDPVVAMLADQLVLIYEGVFATAASIGADGPPASLGAIVRELLGGG